MTKRFTLMRTAMPARMHSAGGTRNATGALPNLIVIGAQKCGTTALHLYLQEHPDISMSRPKELNFFATSVHRAKGVRWYERHFDPRKRVRGESSPAYSADALPSGGRRSSIDPYYLGVPERMHALIPDARLIYMVRDPIERIRAQWCHLHSRGFQRKSLEAAVARRGSTYLARSSYGFQLGRFLERYPIEQVMVVDQDDLLHRRRETLAAVFRFLGVDEAFWDPSYDRVSHVTGDQRRRTPLGLVSDVLLPRRLSARLLGRAPFSRPFAAPEMSDRLRGELTDRLGDDVARFRALTGRRFEHWSV